MKLVKKYKILLVYFKDKKYQFLTTSPVVKYTKDMRTEDIRSVI